MGRNLPVTGSKVAQPQATPAVTPSAVSEYTTFLTSVAKNPALIVGYSKLLKSAGFYKGKITEVYTPALQKAFDKAEQERMSISTIRPIGRDDFLKETISIGGGGGAQSNIQTYQINDTSANALINKLFQDLTGYSASPKDIEKYKKDLRAAQKANPTRQTYDSAGNLLQSGGMDNEQYLTEKIERTGAAQTSKATDAYALMMQELGGLR
jgi:hypothetical protein